MSGFARKARRKKAKSEGRKPISMEKLREGQIALSKGVQEAFGRIMQLREAVEAELEEQQALTKHLLWRVTQLEVACREHGLNVPEPPVFGEPPDDSPGRSPEAAAAVAGEGLPETGEEAADDEG